MFTADDVELGAINAIAQLISSLGVEACCAGRREDRVMRGHVAIRGESRSGKTLVAPWLLNGSIRNDEI
jgi:hypothetical protein